MGVKILHTADWHLGALFSSCPEAQRAMLRQAQREIPEKIAEICRREGCDLVLLAGDVFDGAVSREVVETVKRALAECGVPVLVSPGNHDPLGPDSLWQREKWPDNVFVFGRKLESIALQGLDCRVWGAGYESMDCPGLLEGFRAEQTETYAIGLLHADPVTKNSPYCPITAAQIRNSGLDYLALGHIHKAGMLRLDGKICAWPGCPMGRGWDETGEKGVCIVTVSDGVEVRFLPIDTPRFYDLQWEGSPEAAAAALIPPGDSKNIYRITLTGEKTGPEIPVEQSIFLTVRDWREEKTELWALAEEDSLRGVYFGKLRELAGEDPRAELAAEISRKILEGREVMLP